MAGRPVHRGRVRMAVAAAIAVACVACSTPYGAKGPLGGFTDRRLAADRYEVEFGGNGYTSPELVANMYLYRCAELTVQQKYEVFRSRNPNDSTPEPWAMPLASRAASADEPTPLRSAGGHVIYIPTGGGGGGARFYKMTGIVHMARYDDVPRDVWVLDARKVMKLLAPVVLGTAKDKPLSTEQVAQQASVTGRGAATSGTGATTLDDLRGLIRP